MKQLSLSIPTRCTERWEGFTPNAQGGFCSSCNKTVVDFTSMSDAQVLAYFRQSSIRTCGRFRKDQLKIYSVPQNHTHRYGYRLLKAGIISLAMVAPGYSQAYEDKTNIEADSCESHCKQVEVAVRSGLTVNGVVLSAEDGMPLPGVATYLKGSTAGTTTDAEGRFEFPQQLEPGDILVFAFIGLETTEYIVPQQSTGSVKIEMSMAMMEFMGEVAVNQIYDDHPSGLKKMWHKVKAFF